MVRLRMFYILSTWTYSYNFYIRQYPIPPLFFFIDTTLYLLPSLLLLAVPSCCISVSSQRVLIHCHNSVLVPFCWEGKQHGYYSNSDFCLFIFMTTILSRGNDKHVGNQTFLLNAICPRNNCYIYFLNFLRSQ